MKKTIFCLLAVALSAATLTAQNKKDVITKEKGGVTVVNTTTIAKDVIGYNSPTPIKIYIKKNKVESIEALPNQETPKHWNAVWKLMKDKWNGLKVKDAKALKVDGKTGATFSSDALKENVKRGLEYYEKNK